MTVSWNPKGNPVHFLIELHDILRGGFDRFLTTSPKNESLIAEQRQSLETLRLAVHIPINYGAGRDALISETMTFLRNKANEISSEFDPVTVKHLIKDEMINALVGLSNIPPVHLRDATNKAISADGKIELASQLNTQSELVGSALRARQALLQLLGDLGCAVPRHISARSVSGEADSSRFRDLMPEVPSYRGETLRPTQPAMVDFNEDYNAKYSPTPPNDVHSDPKNWTLKEVVYVCRMPQTDRPTLFRDPRAAYLTLVEKLESQLWIELYFPQQARRESRRFRKNMYVRLALSALETEIRVDHGRLQPTNPEWIKSAFEPLQLAVHILQDFVPAPLPLPSDQKLESLNLGDEDIITSAMVEASLRRGAHDDSEMALDRLIEATLTPAKVEFGKYALHCYGVPTAELGKSSATGKGANALTGGDGIPAVTSPATLSETMAITSLLRVFTNTISDKRIVQAAQVLANENLRANEKLTQIHVLLPFPPTASAEKLGEMLMVSGAAIKKTAWWTENRKGEKSNEVGRRRSKHHEKAKGLEHPASCEDDE